MFALLHSTSLPFIHTLSVPLKDMARILLRFAAEGAAAASDRQGLAAVPAEAPGADLARADPRRRDRPGRRRARRRDRLRLYGRPDGGAAHDFLARVEDVRQQILR